MFHIFCIFLLTFQFNVNVFCFLGLCLGCYFLSGLLNWRVTCSRPGEVSRSLYVSCCLFLDFWVSDKSCYYDSLYSYTKNYVVLVWSDTTELTKTPIDINVTIGTVINSHQGHMSDIIRPMFRTRRIHIYLSNTFISMKEMNIIFVQDYFPNYHSDFQNKWWYFILETFRPSITRCLGIATWQDLGKKQLWLFSSSQLKLSWVLIEIIF